MSPFFLSLLRLFAANRLTAPPPPTMHTPPPPPHPPRGGGGGALAGVRTGRIPDRILRFQRDLIGARHLLDLVARSGL